MYAPLVMAMAVLMALSRTSTEIETVSATSPDQKGKSLTCASITNSSVQDSHEFGDYMVHFIEPSKNSDDVRAWIGVFFAQDARQEDSQSLLLALVSNPKMEVCIFTSSA